ncbi:unnamed protein product [Larinioides sclopetarius]|uniref:Uncharacterized protein n=1 Tax=Larinioides sclopetarius TaxID=280406 RepID=A0AAV2C1K5_9ARAC
MFTFGFSIGHDAGEISSTFMTEKQRVVVSAAVRPFTERMGTAYPPLPSAPGPPVRRPPTAPWSTSPTLPPGRCTGNP